jgi:hypothetical protein
MHKLLKDVPKNVPAIITAITVDFKFIGKKSPINENIAGSIADIAIPLKNLKNTNILNESIFPINTYARL